MTHLLVLFAASFTAVFAQAFQSKSVNGGHYLLAVGGSVFIASSQALVWKAVAPASSGWHEIATYALGGAVGVVCAMWAHHKLVSKKRK